MFKIALLLILHFYKTLSIILPFFVKNSKKEKNSIYYFSIFFPENAGYHWRVKKWADLLEQKRYNVFICQATNKKEFYGLLAINRTLFLIKYLHRRFWQVIASRKYETVIVRRELLFQNDYGNLFLEKLLLKIHPNTILDFDDDIAYAKKEPRKIDNFYAKVLQENGNKFLESITMYKRFFVGSNYLKKYVLEKNPSAKIEVIPTCVDYEKYEAKKYDLDKEEIVFGWVGGNHNLFLLENIIEPLNKIAEKHKISLLVISGRKYKNEKARFNIVNKQWSLETEIVDIKRMDIGLMPLLNTPRDKGKAGFKLIQYMGLGIVSVASAVTVNCDIVDDNKNGFLVFEDDWSGVLSKVIEQKDEFSGIGKKAMSKIQNNYSFNSNLSQILSLLKKS